MYAVISFADIYVFTCLVFFFLCMCVCGLSISDSSVPWVTGCQHSVTKVLPVTPAAQPHRHSHTQTYPSQSELESKVVVWITIIVREVDVKALSLFMYSHICTTCKLTCSFQDGASMVQGIVSYACILFVLCVLWMSIGYRLTFLVLIRFSQMISGPDESALRANVP